MKNVIIVGAGPMGCYTAQLLREKGFKPILLEEHFKVGRPVQCAGIVGKQVFEKTSIPFLRDSILNIIHGAKIQYKQESFTIHRNEVAFIIDREKFDQNLSQGLDIRYQNKVCEIKSLGNRYLVRTTRGAEWEADLLIGADGPNSIVRKCLFKKIPEGQQERINILNYPGVQYRLKIEEPIPFMDIHKVKIQFFDHIPFFLWVIPENHEFFRIGIIGDKSKKILDQFIAENQIQAHRMELNAGRITIGDIPIYWENIALVGDAACQVKPLTGGGIFYGMKGAEILADCIQKGRLADYQKMWKNQFGKEINFGMKARRLYENLRPEQFKDIFEMFQENKQFIEGFADFENHFSLFGEVIRKPKMLLQLGHIARYYLEIMLNN